MGKSTKVDNSGANAAALMQAQLSREQLDWAKQIYGETADERAAATAVADQVSRSQLEAQNLQNKVAQAGYEDYTSTYRPLEQKLVADAQAYDTPERRAAEAAAASADVETSIAAQRGATMRAMERSGVNPASSKVMPGRRQWVGSGASMAMPSRMASPNGRFSAVKASACWPFMPVSRASRALQQARKVMNSSRSAM